MPMDLRPLTLGELLDRAFSLYRTHFRTFVAIMAPPAACAAAVSVLAELFPSLFGTLGPPETLDFGTFVMALGMIGLFFLLSVAYMAVYGVAFGAATAAVASTYIGESATAAGAYGAVRSRIGRLLLLLLLITVRLVVILVIGMTIAIPAGLGLGMLAQTTLPAGAAWIGGIGFAVFLVAAMLATCFFALRYALAFAALVLEPIGAAQAVTRSVELTRGNLWRVLLLVVFGAVITYITLFLFQGPFAIAAALAEPGTRSALWLSVAGAAAGALGGAVSGPVMAIALALLYYDARVRQEGLDLQLMMQRLDAAPPPGPPAAPAVQAG